nr:MAG TPA: hypothetical protein [Caudoviricetes sp.]
MKSKFSITTLSYTSPSATPQSPSQTILALRGFEIYKSSYLSTSTLSNHSLHL